MSNYTSYRARFQGTLAGIKVEELKGLDFEKTNLIDRMEEVINKLDKVEPFFNEYFFQKENDSRDNGEFGYIENDKIEYFRYSPNTTDELSEDINICKIIQSYGSYILNSKDLPREKQQEYTILTEEEFEKQLLKEMATDFKADSSAVLDCRPKNDYNNLDHKITKKDLYPHLQDNKYGVREKDLYLAKVLNDYETFREYLRGEMRKLKNGEPTSMTLYSLKTLLGGLAGDVVDSKKMILGTRAQAKRLGDESPTNDYGKMDYNNPEHIKAILKHCKLTRTPRPDDMMSHIGYDVNQSILRLKKNGKFDKIDLEIVECYNAGYTLKEIGIEVERGIPTIQQRLDKIFRQISKDLGE
ncbi:MAG: hypothetical protein ACRCX2_31895 [Paraclostridium sp.]